MPRISIAHISITSVLLCLSLGLGVASAQDTQDPQPTAWDQAVVTAQAKELNLHVKGAYEALMKQDSARRGSGQSQIYLLVKDRMRVARNEARHLERALREGKSRQETIHTFDRLMTMVRDAREGMNRMYLEAPLIAQIDAARSALRTIAPYSHPSILADIEACDKRLDTHQRKD
jgi:hypothetical protein